MSTIPTPWKTSSRSGGGECVEIRIGGDGRRQVRDSKDRMGPVLSFSEDAFAALIADLKDGGLRRA